MKPHEAWCTWLDSEEGRLLTAPNLEAKSENRQYMENRLYRAFMAGWRGSEDHTREVIIRRIDAWIKQFV